MIYCEYGNESDGSERKAFELTDHLSMYQQVKRELAKTDFFDRQPILDLETRTAITIFVNNELHGYRHNYSDCQSV